MENKDFQEILFLSEIESEIASLDLQRLRIFEFSSSEYPFNAKPTHDADFYMIVLRRLYRRLEEKAQYDSRVANLKGKYLNLCQKIKIRDHFEHGVDYETISQISPGIKVIRSVVINKTDSHIISGDQKWFLDEDHEKFKRFLEEFITLFPFKTNKISDAS